MGADLLIFPDYLADPLWLYPQGGMVGVNRLPLSDATRDAVRDWARRWDKRAFADLDATRTERDPAKPKAWERIHHEGAALCERIRAELGAGWRVGRASWPDGERHVQWETNGPIVPLPQ